MDDIIYNQLPPSHHHYHLAPFSFSSSSRSWTTTAGLASWVHHLQCASLQITICHKCNNVHPAQGIFAIWCTGRHQVVVTSVLFHILHFSASWPCFDPADHGRLLTDHTKPFWIASFNNEPQSCLFIFSCISCCLYWKMINRIFWTALNSKQERENCHTEIVKPKMKIYSPLWANL